MQCGKITARNVCLVVSLIKLSNAFTARQTIRNGAGSHCQRRITFAFERQVVSIPDFSEANQSEAEGPLRNDIEKDTFLTEGEIASDELNNMNIDVVIADEGLSETISSMCEKIEVGASSCIENSDGAGVGRPVFQDADDADRTEPNEIYDADTNAVSADEGLQEAISSMREKINASASSGIESPDGASVGSPVFPDADDADRTELISAVLAVSEEAANLQLSASAAAAEVTLSEDVTEHIRNPMNGTEAGTFYEAPVDDILTEVLPTAAAASEPEHAETSIVAPSVSKILKFAVPAIAVWLCGPLLSLIDTSTVGLLSGTLQQAALNPAVAVTDYAALLIAFLFTGSTNLLAAARESDRCLEGSPRTKRTLIGALQLSTFVGAGLGSVLFLFARTLLRALIGNDAINPVVFGAAMKYIRIRALGMPAAAIIGSAQSACLGMQDVKSPLLVLLAAAVINFFGDMIFVGCSHPMIGGAAGAAWATVFSQYAAVAFFLKYLCSKPNPSNEEEYSKPKVVNLSNQILELTGKSGSSGEKRRTRFREGLCSVKLKNPKKQKNQNDSPFSVKGCLSGKFRAQDIIKFPSAETTKEFVPFMAPVTATQLGRVSGYVAMSHVVSSSLGTASMAAQQVLVSLFYCLCPIADSLSLTAQSFTPAIAEKKPSVKRAKALRQTLKNFYKAGGVFGALMVSAVACIPLISRFFTPDPVVASLVNMVVPILFGFFSVHGILCAAEGLLLGQKDLSFLGRMYAAYFLVVPWFMLRVKRAALSATGNLIDLTSVWKVFLGYQLFRAFAWTGRVLLIQRRTDREANSL